MCGIGGYILQASAPRDPSCLLTLLQGVRQRGPDDEGVVVIDRLKKEKYLFSTERSQPDAARRIRPLEQMLPAHDVAFVQSRYAIIDLSSGGHQPFLSQDGTCAAVFNGEIYNYKEIREELSAEGVFCRTSSDTEVLVEGWCRWQHGLWPRLNGFWAVAIYDARHNEVVLCRDRLGVAPLYYRQAKEGLFFSSLIEPLRQAVSGAVDINRDALRGYLSTGLKDHENTTFYENIFSLPPASAVTFPAGQAAIDRAADRRYWALPTGPLTTRDLSFQEAADQLRSLVMDAVHLRLRSDVPVAFELSGGLDSSSVVALAAQILDRKLTAYTIKVDSKDESPYAAALARRYHIDHRVLCGMEQDFVKGALDFGRKMEEPYDTPANYTHHLMLRRMKKEGFGVVLTGAGGDEALAGYEASFWPAARRALHDEGNGLHAEWHEFRRRFHSWAQGFSTISNYPRALVRRMGFCRSRQGGSFPGDCRADALTALYNRSDFFARRLFHCRVGLLPYYLRSTDHYTMNIPVEHRFPLLDYRVVELGLRMPAAYLFSNGWTKCVLRRAMRSLLPSAVLWRKKKMGFPFDFAAYFQQHEDVFGTYLSVLERSGLGGPAVYGYRRMLKEDPARLWRALSVGIWLEQREAAES